MSLQYVGLSEINGPLVFLDNVENASYEEMVEIKCGDGTTRLGRVVQLLCCVGGNGGDGRIHLLSPCAMLFVALITMLQQ